jgi:catechol 2,3-dioxygenase
MKIDLERRTLLRLVRVSSLAAATVFAGKAKAVADVPARPSSAVRRPMHIGMVTLRVRNLQLVTGFYRDAIGLTVMEHTATGVRLGASGVPLIELEGHPEASPDSKIAAGLYHAAFVMPTRKELAQWLVYAIKNRIKLTGFADHLVTESIYLDDPEGNGIEVYADRPPELWQWNSGSVAMGVYDLDINDLLELVDTRVITSAKAPDGLRIGHIHLRVGDLERAVAFYRDVIGLDLTRQMDGAAFLSSGGYHHHVAVNIWQSAGAGQRDSTAAGLAWFSIEVGAQSMLAAAEERLRRAGTEIRGITNGIEIVDPWGTRLHLVKV